METQIYTADFFINKFEPIHEALWCIRAIGHYNSPKCALGHCSFGERGEFMHDSVERTSLCSMFMRVLRGYVHDINNGDDPRYQQPTPKQRILAALYDIKKAQQPKEPEVKERIVYVCVDKEVRELQKEEPMLN